ncbi:MAG: hydantoinase/oxoprolinase family protein [Thermoanaerobaculia bacterium]|nr:hydantoinase/oxoprolinase family protein [Thermoanaerobaculia bacterium]
MWRLWIDTGGTFTDCLALDPSGRLRRAKVLSSSGLRGVVVESLDRSTLRLDLGMGMDLPDGFLASGTLRALESERGVCISSSSGAEVRAPEHDLTAGDRIELQFDEEAPILAARLVTGAARAADLPPLELRLATTRGTNALLERRGARTVFLVTRGFADLLVIGDQRRPDLFALQIDRPEPLYERVVEVEERLAADGEVVEPLDLDSLKLRIKGLRAEGFESAAVALLHSYLQETEEVQRVEHHERRVAGALRDAGFQFVSRSAELSPSIKILPRAETAVVDAYLSPVVGRYLDRVCTALFDGAREPRQVRVMTSAGGLVSADRFRAKDSLLSGPAGGVVGAACVGREVGFKRLIAFDMGGTSTDVSRFDGDYEYRFEQQVGDATIAAPSLGIETVAAGGGSICGFDGPRLTVGPQSAGASPGPACYGAGGPLTLTDVNLLLGRLDPRRFGIPVDVAAAAAARDRVLESLHQEGSAVEADQLLRGYLEVADLRMAGAVRRISVRQGYDPREYTLVAFGGAGGQHACAVAEELGISTIVLPREAGLLSALGLGTARIERFAQRQILRPLEDLEELDGLLGEVTETALGELATEGIAATDSEVRRRIAFLRFAGQDATLEIEIELDIGHDTRTWLARKFVERYEHRFGYRPGQRPIEVESLRVVASSRESAGTRYPSSDPLAGTLDWARLSAATPQDRRRVCFDDWYEVPVYDLQGIEPAHRVDGPALVFDTHASLTLAPGWQAVAAEVGSLVARRSSSQDGSPSGA